MPLKVADLAHLRHADERERTGEVESAREARQLRHRLPRPAIEVGTHERAAAGFEQPDRAAVHARRVRHRQAAQQDRVRLHVDEHAAVPFVCAPRAGLVGGAQCGHVLRAALDHGESIEVAAILRRPGADERGAPLRHEAGVVIQRAQAVETRVHRPQLAVSRKRHLVDVDGAGEVLPRRDVAGVMRSRRIELPGDRGLIAIATTPTAPRRSPCAGRPPPCPWVGRTAGSGY